LLATVSKHQVWERLPPETRRYVDAFWECGQCGQLYWEGSHMPHIRQFIENLQARAGVEIPFTGQIAGAGK
jgi:uncharacterized protein with PIN domain